MELDLGLEGGVHTKLAGVTTGQLRGSYRDTGGIRRRRCTAFSIGKGREESR